LVQLYNDLAVLAQNGMAKLILLKNGSRNATSKLLLCASRPKQVW
jgi:hypothetical protein